MSAITTVTLIGLATYYSPGVMERVADYRGLSCSDCIGYAAMVDPQYLGQHIWIGRPGERTEGPFLVVDCGQAEHRAAQTARGLIAEVDYQTARRWNMRGPIPVRVSIPDAPAEYFRPTMQQGAIP